MENLRTKKILAVVDKPTPPSATCKKCKSDPCLKWAMLPRFSVLVKYHHDDIIQYCHCTYYVTVQYHHGTSCVTVLSPNH